MTRNRQIWIWLGVLVAVLFMIYVINDILLPFLVGIAIAYFLDPVADRLERQGCSRAVATGIISVAFFATAAMVLILLYPLVQDQMIAFFHKIPTLVEALTKRIEPITADLRRAFPVARMEELQDAGKSFIGTAASWFGRVMQGLWAGGLALFNAISIVLITPIVAFYLLRDWGKITMKVDSWLPREFAPTIRALFIEIDSIISGFIRGAGTVVLFLATVYAAGLTMIGLDFGLLVGLMAGFLSFIPYVGSFVGVTLALIIALVQFGDLLHIALVLAVFGFGQAIESFYLTPKLVGEKVGLHPVWVMFALMVGGLLLGFTGVLLAIPIAATIGVLVRFFLAQYLMSPLYNGGSVNSGDKSG